MPDDGDRRADALFVAVDRGGVDVAVADLERLAHGALGLVGRHLEDAVAELRDGVAVVEFECRNRHGSSLRPGADRRLRDRGHRSVAPCPTSRSSGPRPKHIDHSVVATSRPRSPSTPQNALLVKNPPGPPIRTTDDHVQRCMPSAAWSRALPAGAAASAADG